MWGAWQLAAWKTAVQSWALGPWHLYAFKFCPCSTLLGAWVSIAAPNSVRQYKI